MKFIRKCTGEEYAHSFWVRQNRKDPKTPIYSSALEQMKKPVDQGGHPYKLPSPELRRWAIWQLTTPAELGTLMVIQDLYMETHELIVKPPTLGNIARRAIETDYFANVKEGTQQRLYHEWTKGTLENRITDDDRLCLRALTDEEGFKSPTSSFYIVDGWGRSLPYLTLVYLGHEFVPIAAYIAE